MSSISKLRTPAVLSVAAATAGASSSSVDRCDAAAPQSLTAASQSSLAEDVDGRPHSSWVNVAATTTTVGGKGSTPGLSPDQIDDASRVIFHREQSVGSSTAGELKNLSLLIDMGTELAKDPRVQQSVADRMQRLKPASPSPACLPLSTTTTPAARGSEQAQGLQETVRQLEEQVALLRDEVVFMQDMNEHLVYQNCQLQDALERERQGGSQAAAAAAAAVVASDEEEEEEEAQFPTAMELEEDRVKDRGLFEEDFEDDGQEESQEEEEWPSNELLIKGALGLAASIVLLALLKRHGVRKQLDQVAATIKAATAAAAKVL
uniref:Uncharacterized protein n=1 Tax=Rhizochromulina marina TaxID=1034831 RepID=A0A7S2RPB8_9STRA